MEAGTPLNEIPVDIVFIGSCTNSRIEDLREAAAIAKGRKKADNVQRVLIVPGSGLVKEQAEKEGLHEVFIEAGFEWREPGLLYVPRHECRPPDPGTTLRLYFQP